MQALKKYTLIIFLLGGLFTFRLSAQTVLDRQVDFISQQKTLSDALYDLSMLTGINISYGNFPQLSKLSGPFNFKNQSLGAILTEMLKPANLSFKLVGQQIALFRLPVDPPRFTIKGYLQDDLNGEKLISANVYDPDSYRGTSTNVYGFYSLTLPAGITKLTYSYLGYMPQTKVFDLKKDTLLNINLKSDNTLAEVVVLGSDSLSTNKFGDLSKENVSLDQVKKLPALMGESDVIRTAFLLPGVQSGGDGVGGLFVRGGNADQNLVLLDGVPVYNATHLVGIFSIFNSSAIRSASLVKGSFPARYGGRLSSVLDVRTKEGNQKNFEAEVGLGIISGKVSLEGPLVKDKSAFFISYRRSFLDLIMRPVTKYLNRDFGVEGFSAYKYEDFNAKVNFPVSKRDEFFLSFYTGGDDFEDRRLQNLPDYSIKDYQLLNWGNTIASFRWNHQFGNKLFANTTATFSEYNFQSQGFIGVQYNTADSTAKTFFFANQYESIIRDLALKIDFDYRPNPEHYLRFGSHFTRHKFQPRIASVNENNEIDFGFSSNPSSLSRLFGNAFIEAYEGSAYVEDEINIRRELRMNLGLHSSYFRVGSQTYWSVQPRVSAQVFIENNWSLNFSFAQMRQHLHLLTRSGFGLPEDLWVPSTDQIRPQESWQAVLGLKFVPATRQSAWQAGFEAYFKRMNHVLAYQEGTLFNFIDGDNWEQNVTEGKGWAYGLEFSGAKLKGNTTGLMNVTLAWSERQFEEISSGQKFDFRYDRRLFVKLAGVQHFSKRFELSLSWVFGTGNGITLPTSVSEYIPSKGILSITQPFVAYNYGARNAYRMEAYHRFDIGFNFRSDKSWGYQVINAGVYNLYNRRNPLYITLRTTEEDPEKSEYLKYSLIPLLPQVSYSLHLKNWKRKNAAAEQEKLNWPE